MKEQNQACSCCTPISLEISDVPNINVIGICPSCHQKGKKVDTATLKAMLAMSLREVRSTTYFFCPTADCLVVYFSEDQSQVFTTAQIRERVFQKEPGADDVFVCYCFRHTVGSIRREIVETGQSTAVDNINTGIAAGQCACDWRNPQGTCCLGNVRNLVKALHHSATGSSTSNHAEGSFTL
ncbi:MAG: hypothetical protein K8I82_20100 [Anaerolineae bacterium]|nr:hypothetical protein [Anaerolineae bacterium]